MFRRPDRFGLLDLHPANRVCLFSHSDFLPQSPQPSRGLKRPPSRDRVYRVYKETSGLKCMLEYIPPREYRQVYGCSFEVVLKRQAFEVDDR